MNKDFDNYCKNNGIKREHTIPYTPQQNGVAKRKNRTLMEMARCMLHARNMDPKFWAEGVNVASYIINRSPTIDVKHKTPAEAWSGRKPIVGHSKVIGCDAYVHMPKEKRKKLDKKSHKCIRLVIVNHLRPTRCMILIQMKFLFRRDVIFDESCVISSKSSSFIPMSSSTLGDPTIEEKFDYMTNEECSESCE